MMPNITKGTRMFGLIQYLAGPGRANEHTEQRVITASESIVSVQHGERLSPESAARLGHELDIPKAVFGTNFKTPHVFHVSLSLKADEGTLSDEKWSEIAQDFAEGMGFTGSDGKPPCRWVAIHHGGSKAGNDHIHLAVSMIREDGTRWSQHNDQPRSQKLAEALELKHGLRASRGVHAERGYHPKEKEFAQSQGLAELPRETLQRTVRAASTASVDEAEFVRRLRGAGVLVRPRYAQGGSTIVEGYSVALKPPARGEKAAWFGGGRLARDLTLPKMRTGWDSSPQAQDAAAAEWEAVTTGKRISAPGREATEPTAEQWEKYTTEVGQLYERIKSVPTHDPALWAQVARETSGAFSAWSLRTEAVPGPLAETAKILSRTAQLRRFPVRPDKTPLPSAKGAGMLLMQSSVGPSTAAGEALLLAQLRNTMRAIHDMHKSTGRLSDANRVRDAAMDRLATVKTNLDGVIAQSGTTATLTKHRPASAPTVEATTGDSQHMDELKRLVNLSRPGAAQATGKPVRASTADPAKKDAQGKDQGRGR